MEVRCVGVHQCSHCHHTLVLLLPWSDAADLPGKAIALGVRVEPAVAAFLNQRDDDVPSLVQCVMDLWRKHGEVPTRVVLTVDDSDALSFSALIGILYLRGPVGVTAVRCTPGEGVLIAVELQLPCIVDQDPLESPELFHRIAWRGRASTVH